MALSLIREIPDWGIGTITGMGMWGFFAFNTLAPRAMENDQQQEIIPACFAQLRQDEGQAIDHHITKLTREARREMDYRRTRIEDELDEALEELAEIEVTGMAIEHYNSTPLAMLAPLPDFNLSADPLKKRIAAFEEEIASLRVPDFEVPKAPSSEVMEACGCSVSIAFGGAQMAYGLSLASFRIWTPEEMTHAKSGWADILQTDKCGQRSWEAL